MMSSVHCLLVVLELTGMVVKWRHCYVKVTSSCHVASQRIQELQSGRLFLKTLNVVFNGEQEKEFG